MRPQGGLNLVEVSPTKLSEVLLRATKLTWRKAEFRLRIDGVQNTATVSTSHREAAETLHHLKQVMFGGTIYPVQLYGLAPDDSVKGVIHDIPLRYSSQEILENIFLPGFEFIACRRLGNSTTVIVTILGTKVPFYVYHRGATCIGRRFLPASSATNWAIDPRPVHGPTCGRAPPVEPGTRLMATCASHAAPCARESTSRHLRAAHSGSANRTSSDRGSWCDNVQHPRLRVTNSSLHHHVAAVNGDLGTPRSAGAPLPHREGTLVRGPGPGQGPAAVLQGAAAPLGR